MDWDISIELATKLETIRKNRLDKSPVVTSIAKLIHKYQVTDMELLNEVADGLAGRYLSKEWKESDELSYELTPQDLLDAEIITEEIAPIVQKIRNDFFGTEDPPFSNRNLVKEWLIKQSWSVKRIVEKIQEQVKEMNGEGVTRQIWIDGLIFPDIPECKTIINLNKEIEYLAEKVGAYYEDTWFHILVGTKLIVSSPVLHTGERIDKLPSGRQIHTHIVNIELRKGLSFTEWRDIYRTVKKKIGRQKTKQINARHLELFHLVKRRGGPPNNQIVSFWKEVMRYWNEKHPEQKYTTWKGVQRAYNLIIARVNSEKKEARNEAKS